MEMFRTPDVAAESETRYKPQFGKLQQKLEVIMASRDTQKSEEVEQKIFLDST